MLSRLSFLIIQYYLFLKVRLMPYFLFLLIIIHLIDFSIGLQLPHRTHYQFK